MLRRAVIAAAFALAAGPAVAAEKEKGEIGQYVDLQPLGLPIIAKGQLVNYVFVYVRINLTSQANAARLRDREPYFRDALVRVAHRTPFTLPSDYTKIDEAKLTATMFQQAEAIAGPGQIKSVVVTSQTPRRRIATPAA